MKRSETLTESETYELSSSSNSRSSGGPLWTDSELTDRVRENVLGGEQGIAETNRPFMELCIEAARAHV